MNYNKDYANYVVAIGQIECLRILIHHNPQALEIDLTTILPDIDKSLANPKTITDIKTLFPILLSLEAELLNIVAEQPRLLSREADEAAREVLDSICISYKTCTLCPTREAISSKLSQIKTDSKYYRDACRYMCLLEVAPPEVLKYIREDFLMTFDTNKTVSDKTSLFD